MNRRRLLLRRLALAALAILLLAFTAYSARFALDFGIYYNAGAKVLAGDIDNLYPQDRPPPGSLVPFHVYRYPPVAAVLMAPLALLPLQVSAFLFGLTKLAALYGIVVLVMRLSGTARRHRGWILGLSMLGIGGYFIEEFRNGNAHLLLLAAIVATVYLAERRRDVFAGLLLGVAACFKLTPLIYVPYFLLRRRWLLCATCVLTLAALFALPSLLFGVAAGDALLDAFTEITLQKTIDPHNYSLRGAILKYLTALDVEEPKYGKINVASLSLEAATTVWWGAVVAVGLVLAACTRGPQQRLIGLLRPDPTAAASPSRPRPSDAERTLLEVSLWATALLLASPHTQRLWFTSLFFPFVVMLALVAGRPEDSRRRQILSAVGGSFLIGTLLPPLMPGRDAALAYEVRSPYLLATLWVFAVQAWLLWPADRTAATEPPAQAPEV